MLVLQENQEEGLFRCPRCNNQVKLPATFNIVHCPKCDAKLQVYGMKCLIERKQHAPGLDGQELWEERWMHSKDIFVFDMTPLSEVNDKEQATREEVLVCPFCWQEVKVKVQPEYQLSDKGRKTESRTGWLTIGISTIIFAILLIFFHEEDVEFHLLPFIVWAICIIRGISFLNKAAPKKVFPSSLYVSEGDTRHSLI